MYLHLRVRPRFLGGRRSSFQFFSIQSRQAVHVFLGVKSAPGLLISAIATPDRRRVRSGLFRCPRVRSLFSSSLNDSFGDRRMERRGRMGLITRDRLGGWELGRGTWRGPVRRLVAAQYNLSKSFIDHQLYGRCILRNALTGSLK